MDWNTSIALTHQLLPAGLWDKAIKGAGYLSILTQAVPALLAWGVPAATRGADWLANLILNSPLRSLALWQAPTIVKGLDSATAAFTTLADTFRDRLEADLAKAQATPAPATPPAPTDAKAS